jgi:hypothetical protein
MLCRRWFGQTASATYSSKIARIIERSHTEGPQHCILCLKVVLLLFLSSPSRTSASLPKTLEHQHHEQIWSTSKKF